MSAAISLIRKKQRDRYAYKSSYGANYPHRSAPQTEVGFRTKGFCTGPIANISLGQAPFLQGVLQGSGRPI